MVQRGRVRQRAVAHGVVDDLFNLVSLITQRAQGFRHGLVDDLEITTTSQLLELHQSEIRLNTRGVAIHHQTDGAGGGHNGGLGITVAMGFAQFNGLIPGLARRKRQRFIRQVILIQRHR